MKIIQSTAIVLIGVFLLFSACARPIATTPPTTTPPTAIPPATMPPATTPPATIPPATTPPATTPPTTIPPIPPPAVQGPYDVWLPGHEFKPSILTVPVGTKVTWTNKDGDQHTVTSATGLFDGSISFGQSYSYIFTVPGTYEYFCNPHPDMTGKVIVQ